MPKDPVEKIIAAALDAFGIEYWLDGEADTCGLDFYVPKFNVYIECKQFHSERTTEQMSRARDIIVIQGVDAARAFAQLMGEKIMDLSKITDIEERRTAARLWTEMVAAQDAVGNAGGQGFSDEERAAFDALEVEYDAKQQELEDWFSERKKEIFAKNGPVDPGLDAASIVATTAFEALDRNDVLTDGDDVIVCSMSGVPLWEDDEVLAAMRVGPSTYVLRCLLDLPHAPEPEAEVAEEDQEVAA